MLKFFLDTITAEDFKNYFKREFCYLPIWNNEINYKAGKIVFYDINQVFYKSLISNNINNIPNEVFEAWEEDFDIEYNDYINDTDIEKAFLQAKNMINIKIFGNNEDLLKMCFLMLSAHFLIMDLNMSNGNGASSFLMTSKSIGSVSASYGIPQKILNNPNYTYLASTQFGLKYLQYIMPQLIGNMIVLKGGTSLF